MTDFTPFSALIGGLILGSSAIGLLWLNGKVAGISGIVSRALTQFDKAGLWRWMFILGLIIGPIVSSFWHYSLPQQIDVSWPLIIAGGLFVGIGSKLGSGCTSGHGICGIGRLSLRSIAATVTFMSVAVLVVFVVKHLLGDLL
ncbi:YeeE/YedE family protein [Paraglaciecola aestuariivivens]